MTTNNRTDKMTDNEKAITETYNHLSYRAQRLLEAYLRSGKTDVFGSSERYMKDLASDFVLLAAKLDEHAMEVAVQAHTPAPTKKEADNE